MADLEAEYSLETIGSVAKQLLDAFPQERIFLIDAPMGAGKTTLIKEICTVLGSQDNFSSPTYSIVNEYSYAAGKIYHFDLYRLKGEEELFDIGFEEYIGSGNYCFIEWPQITKNLVDQNSVKIDIRVEGNIRYIHAAKI
ncbi:MAG: tsaE [Bacteroidetes bacterium]|nr:tsaE [Bacteroidota bacterium]